MNDDGREVLEGQHDVIFLGFGVPQRARGLLLTVDSSFYRFSSLVKNIHYHCIQNKSKDISQIEFL